MGRTGIAIGTSVKTASIGIHGKGKADVGAFILADNGLRILLEYLRGSVGWHVEPFSTKTGERIGRIRDFRIIHKNAAINISNVETIATTESCQYTRLSEIERVRNPSARTGTRYKASTVIV